MNLVQRIIITSGPTREFIDPIRYISNPSTGLMGYCIAKAGVQKKYEVIFISGPVSANYASLEGAKNISVVSTSDMLAAVLKEIIDHSVLIMAAAPADFKPEKKWDKKIKKTEVNRLSLIPNADILKEVDLIVQNKDLKNFFRTGFAAETHQSERYAMDKLNSKNLDIIFLNSLSEKGSGFGVSTNRLTVFRKDNKKEKWEMESKEKLGYRIIEEIEEYIEKYSKLSLK